MPTELWFHEQMTGSFAWGVTDPRAGSVAGREAGTWFGFDVTIYVDDLERFLDDAHHPATVSGHYLGNLIPGDPSVKQGSFNFMSPGPGNSRLMEHHHQFDAKGHTYRFDGEKDILNDPLSADEIHDVTTLYSTIRDESNAIVASGVLHFPMRDFFKLVASFNVRGTDDVFAAKMRFLKLFLREELFVWLSGFRRPPAPANRRRTITRPHAEIQPSYDVVVVGSGYGGGVAAARLSVPGAKGTTKSVCVLERGREWRAGDFPDEPWQVGENLRSPLNPGGLFEFHLGSDIDVLVGNGVGGTSLINANVMIEPDRAVFSMPHWPKALPIADLETYFARARAMIAPSRDPAPPLKSTRLLEAAKKVPIASGGDAVDIAVSFADRTRADTDNHQTACVGCGGCVTGCNFTSKNTVDMTYLSAAERQGARIFAEVEVRTIEKTATGYALQCRDHAEQRDRTILAKQVVVAAGSLGSFAILKRSAAAGLLTLSPTLGTGFSGNGDVLGFGYNNDGETDVTNGPTITSVVHFDRAAGVERHFIVEDGGIPRALTAIVRGLLPIVRHQDGDEHHSWIDRFKEWVRVQADRVGVDSDGALNHSLVYLGMGFEDGSGTLELNGDAVTVSWPGVGNQSFAQRIDDAMATMTYALGGTYVKNPEPRSFLTSNLLTVHPLGGCPMGDDADHGVVDAKGQVFGYPGLYVADGSILPTALGVNPALTIAAIAEWIVENIASSS